jgi:hypothetical protein
MCFGVSDFTIAAALHLPDTYITTPYNHCQENDY